MDDLNQTLSVLLNGIIYPIRIFEEQFHTNILFPSSAPSSKFDDSDSAFEEEYVGPSMTAHGEVDGEGDGESKDDDLSSRASERSPLVQYPKFMSRVEGSSSPKADPIYDNISSLSPHANFGDGSNMESKSDETFPPISSNGLPPPSPYDQYPTQSLPLVDQVDPTQFYNVHEPMKLDNHIQDSVNSIPDLNDPVIQNTTMSQEDVELEALISSFQRISENVKKEVCSKVDKKKKPKSKKKKLMASREECRNESVLENIRAQISYTFKLDACRNTTRSS
ncbi:hypothetical protein Tco_0717291 [Tanacetum coccineum]